MANANRRHADANRTPSRGDRENRAPDIRDLDSDEARNHSTEADEARNPSADLAPHGATTFSSDLDLDDGADLDTDETDDVSAAAEQLWASDGPLDEETSEELGVDNVVGPQEAGIGGGLDEQEEARAGITDEQLEEIAKKSRRC